MVTQNVMLHDLMQLLMSLQWCPELRDPHRWTRPRSILGAINQSFIIFHRTQRLTTSRQANWSKDNLSDVRAGLVFLHAAY